MRFADLLAHPGVVENFRPGSKFGMLAFHGGSLERATDQIASAVADRSGASLYTVRQPDDLRWHLPSSEVDPAASPALSAFLTHVDVAIAVHGYGRAGMFTTLMAGGSNRALAATVASTLRPSLSFADTTYEIVDDLDRIPIELRGLHPDNPVNRVRHRGVQLELPPRVRGLGPFWDNAEPETGFSPHTEGLITGLVEAVADWCETHHP